MKFNLKFTNFPLLNSLYLQVFPCSRYFEFVRKCVIIIFESVYFKYPYQVSIKKDN